MTNVSRKVSLRQLQTLEDHNAAVRVVKFNKDGNYCMSGGYDKKIILWNPYQAKKITSYTGHGYQVLDLDISHDHHYFASCGGDKQPFLWDVQTAAIIRKFQGHDAPINCIQFDQSASIIATGSNDQTVKIWDCKSRSSRPIQIMNDARDSVTCIALSSYDIFTISVDGCLRCYDIRMGELRTDTIGHSLSCISISKDSQIVLLSTLSNKLLLFDKEDGVLYHEYEGHVNMEFRVDSTFSNNDSYVLSGSENGTICIWGLEDSELLYKHQAHNKLLMGLSAHPLENYLLTASSDQTIKLWSINVQSSR